MLLLHLGESDRSKYSFAAAGHFVYLLFCNEQVDMYIQSRTFPIFVLLIYPLSFTA